jgi:hypothetical protein
LFASGLKLSTSPLAGENHFARSEV